MKTFVEQEPVYFKRLTLLKPGTARLYGLVVDQPVFVSHQDSLDQRPQVYQVGTEVQTDAFPRRMQRLSITSYHELGRQVSSLTSRPSFGLEYERASRQVITNGSCFWADLQLNGWVAIIEPLGRMIESADHLLGFNGITDRLRVREILACCFSPSCQELQPLSRGIVVGPFGDGLYKPICSTDKHPDALAMDTFSFRIPFDGGPVIFEDKKSGSISRNRIF